VAVTRIIKIGGSLLTDGAAFDAVASRLTVELEQEATWVIVSATHGTTAELAELVKTRELHHAQQIANRHRDWGLVPALAAELVALTQHGRPDELLSWGERASAAILKQRLALLDHRVPIVELRGRSRLPPVGTAIVPGFYLRDSAGRRRLLPRGGSDIAALLVASWKHSPRVRLWKQGGGIRLDGRVAPILASSQLLDHLGTTIHPLHPAAARIAQSRGIELVLEDPWGRHPGTVVQSRMVTA
jgi:aspartokinase